MSDGPSGRGSEGHIDTGSRPSIAEVAAWLRRAAEQRDVGNGPGLTDDPAATEASGGAATDQPAEAPDSTPTDDGEDPAGRDPDPGTADARTPDDSPPEVAVAAKSAALEELPPHETQADQAQDDPLTAHEAKGDHASVERLTSAERSGDWADAGRTGGVAGDTGESPVTLAVEVVSPADDAPVDEPAVEAVRTGPDDHATGDIRPSSAQVAELRPEVSPFEAPVVDEPQADEPSTEAAPGHTTEEESSVDTGPTEDDVSAVEESGAPASVLDPGLAPGPPTAAEDRRVGSRAVQRFGQRRFKASLAAGTATVGAPQAEPAAAERASSDVSPVEALVEDDLGVAPDADLTSRRVGDEPEKGSGPVEAPAVAPPGGAGSLASMFDLDLADLAARARGTGEREVREAQKARESFTPPPGDEAHTGASTTSGPATSVADTTRADLRDLDLDATEASADSTGRAGDDAPRPAAAAVVTALIRQRRARRKRYPRGQLKERIGFLRRVRAMLGVVVLTVFLGVAAGAAIGAFLVVLAFAVRGAITSG